MRRRLASYVCTGNISLLRNFYYAIACRFIFMPTELHWFRLNIQH